MWELVYKESWVLKNWCFWTVVLEKTLESPLDCREIQLVHPKGDQSWVTGRTDVEAETLIKLDSILKSRDISLSTKIRLVMAMIFSVVMYGCESWSIKKAECRRTDAFELWCWRRLLKVPWPARRSKHSILKEISPEYSLEALMLKLKRQYFGHLIQRAETPIVWSLDTNHCRWWLQPWNVCSLEEKLWPT